MASAIGGHPVKEMTANSGLRKGLDKVQNNAPEVECPSLNDSEAADHSKRQSGHAAWGEGNPLNRSRREKAKASKARLYDSAQKFEHLEQMIVSDVAIFNELMEKAHDRYTANMANNTKTIDTFFDRIREDHREFQREFRVHLKDEREREYATIQQMLRNILQTRINALSCEADAVAQHEGATV